MPLNLAKTLKAKQAESKLSNEALAKEIGVSTVSVTGALKGKSKPNATTAKKYAEYLGVTVEELGGSNPKKKKNKSSAGRAAKAPRRAKKGGRQAASKGLGAELVSAVSAAAAVLDDKLALAVHKAAKTERELIARLLSV